MCSFIHPLGLFCCNTQREMAKMSWSSRYIGFHLPTNINTHILNSHQSWSTELMLDKHGTHYLNRILKHGLSTTIKNIQCIHTLEVFHIKESPDKQRTKKSRDSIVLSSNLKRLYYLIHFDGITVFTFDHLNRVRQEATIHEEQRKHEQYFNLIKIIHHKKQ